MFSPSWLPERGSSPFSDDACAPLVPEGPRKIAGGKLAGGERRPRTRTPQWANALEGRAEKARRCGILSGLVSRRSSRALPGRKIHRPAHPGAALADSLAPGYFPLSLRDKSNLVPRAKHVRSLSYDPGQAISWLITAIAAGSSGNITGNSVVRTVVGPVRRTFAFTGQPQAL